MMGKKIKTRQVHKDIKMLDKVVISTEHMKRTYVRTKDSAERTPESQNETPAEYAEKKLSHSADIAVHETAHQVRKQGRKMANTVKEIFKTTTGKGTIKSTAYSIKTAEHTARMTIKTTQKSEKAAQTAASTSIKMTKKAAVAAKQAVRATEQTARTVAHATIT